MRFNIYRDARGEWRWTLYAGNGRKIADSSEGYTRRRNAQNMVEKIMNDVHISVITIDR